MMCTLFSSFGFEERRLFLMGETGAGKSSFGNRLLRNASFAVGDGYDAVTREVACSRGGLFSRERRPVEVCDTPGLNDGSRRDAEIVDGILEAMRERPTHAVLYVHNAEVRRLTRSAKKAMKHLLRRVDDPATAVLFVLTRATALGAGAKKALKDALCSKLHPAFCLRPPSLVFAGRHNKLVDVPTFIDLRLRRSMNAFLDTLTNATLPNNREEEDDARFGGGVSLERGGGVSRDGEANDDDDSDDDESSGRTQRPTTCSELCALCHAAEHHRSQQPEETPPRRTTTTTPCLTPPDLDAIPKGRR